MYQTLVAGNSVELFSKNSIEKPFEKNPHVNHPVQLN